MENSDELHDIEMDDTHHRIHRAGTSQPQNDSIQENDSPRSNGL